MKKIVLPVAVVLLTTVLAGCDIAVAGARCKVGAAPARDTTHVLLCTKGRWTRSITIGQAAEILLRDVPGSLRITSVVPATAPVDEATAVNVRVESYTGAKVANRTVVVTGTGVVGTPTATTDGDGMAFLRFDHATKPGTYVATVAVKDTNLSATFDVVRTPGAPAKVEKLSGDNQTIPSGGTLAAMTARVTDKYGNPAVGRTVYSGSLGEIVVGADGLVVLGSRTVDYEAGPYGVSILITRLSLDNAAVFHHTITVGAPAHMSVSGPSPAPRNLTFGEPVKACLFDSGRNRIPGQTFTFNAVVGLTGATGTLSAPSAIAGSDGCVTVDVTAGSLPGQWAVEAASNGVVASIGLTNL